jgi:alanine dehydrogenase
MAAPGPVFLTLADTQRLMGVRDILEIVEEVFGMQARGQVTWAEPPRFTIHGRTESIYSHVKGCVLETLPVLGVRVVGYHIAPDGSGTASPESTRLVALTEPSSGRLLAIVDEHWNYAVRTSAAAVVGAKYLARADSRVVGIVGAGSLSRTGLAALAEVFPLKGARVTSRRASSYQEFAREMTRSLGLPVEPVASAEAAVAGADIVLVATTAKTPLVQEPWVGPGTCVISLGTNEVDPALYGKVEHLVVDERAEVGRLLERTAGVGRIPPDRMALIEDWVAGRRTERTGPGERSLIKTVGLVSQDVAVAYRTYQRAQAQGLGIPLGGRSGAQE